MEKVSRRVFCGTSFLAYPLMNVFAKQKKNAACTDTSISEDPIMDVLAKQFAETTYDGARKGFGSEHFRQYAGYVRIYDAQLYALGTDKKFDENMEEDDYHLLDPDNTVRMTADFWKKHGVLLNENNLRGQVSFDRDSYRQIKKTIKKMGGIRALHGSLAEAFERKAEEAEQSVFRGGPIVRNGKVIFPADGNPVHWIKPAEIVFDVHSFIGIDLDCLCKAMAVEGAVLALICVVGCVPCCTASAVMLALEILMNTMGGCDPELC